MADEGQEELAVRFYTTFFKKINEEKNKKIWMKSRRRREHGLYMLQQEKVSKFWVD